VFAQGDYRQWSYPYHLGKYHIIQYRANVRSEPTRNSDVIAVLSLNDEIEILENSLIEERINDAMSYWYKIKYGNIIGYTFGGNIAYESFVTDIDKNGINDYFYFRYSWWSGIFKPLTDIVIYINNQRISTNIIAYHAHDVDSCEFIEEDGYVFITLGLTDRGDHYGTFKYYFKVTSDGRIEYLRSEW
jgi:hypothetical protein